MANYSWPPPNTAYPYQPAAPAWPPNPTATNAYPNYPPYGGVPPGGTNPFPPPNNPYYPPYGAAPPTNTSNPGAPNPYPNPGFSYPGAPPTGGGFQPPPPQHTQPAQPPPTATNAPPAYPYPYPTGAGQSAAALGLSPAAVALAAKAAGTSPPPAQHAQHPQQMTPLQPPPTATNVAQQQQQATTTTNTTSSQPGQQQQAPQIATTVGGKNPSEYQFLWYDNAQGWCPYSPDVNFQISKAYLEGKPSVSLSSLNKITITIDFATLVQQGSDNTVRKVKMNYLGPTNPLLGSNPMAAPTPPLTGSGPGTNPWMSPPAATSAHPPLPAANSAPPPVPPKVVVETGTWFWDADGTPNPFSDSHTAQLESAFTSGQHTTTLNINGHDYTVDFKAMHQVNNKTKFSRKITREVSKTTTGGVTEGSTTKPLPNHGRPPRPASASMGSRGGEMATTTTTTAPSAAAVQDSYASDPTMACPIPPGQANNLELLPVTKNSAEWTQVEKRFLTTMTGKGKIETIVKVSNKNLWKKFVLERDQVMEKNNNDQSITYTRLLFHGTRNTTPDLIYNSESGFMMQFCSKGMWGIGTYFAEKSVYSNDYCHTTATGKKQMFLAVVITGDFYDCKPDNSFKVPPERTTKKNKHGSRTLRFGVRHN